MSYILNKQNGTPRFACLYLCVTYIFFLHSTGFCSSVPEPRPLAEICKNSDVITIARISKYVPSPDKVVKHQEYGGSVTFILYYLPIKLPGKYDFDRISDITGKSSPKISLDIGYISRLVYTNLYAKHISDWKLEKDSRVLLFLKRGANGKFVPTDELMPFLPVAAEAKANPSMEASKIDKVIHVLLTSLKDPENRRIITHFLLKIENPQIPIAMADYIDDPDINIRDNVLYCLGTNKQVSAIPLIAKFASEHQAMCITTLGDYWSKDAQQYLKPLLLNTNSGIRSSAICAVGRFSDYKTVPYLLFALQDKDWQKEIPEGADIILNYLVSEGKLQEDTIVGEDFFKHGKERIPKYYSWWNDELLGKHLDKEREKTLDSPPADNSPVEKLNPALFDPRVDIRRKAMALLQKRADGSSIPYLIMALRDPDQEVAYSAYQKVNPLAALTPMVQTAAQFNAKQRELADTLLEWWHTKYDDKDPLKGMR